MANTDKVVAADVMREQIEEVLNKANDLWYNYDINPDSVVIAMLYIKVDELISLLRKGR